MKAAPGAHAYHRAGWSSVIERAFGQQTYKLISEDASGRVNGVLPLARLRSRLFGDFLVSLPYLNYGGPCAIDAETESRLVDEAVRLAREENVQHLELRLTAPEGFGLHVKASKVSMRLALAEDADSLWKSFPSKLRNQVNRPIKEGMVARVGGLETDAVASFLQALAEAAGLTVHVRLLEGRETQHVLDAIFKALGISLAQACRPRPGKE